jgi:diguanylate cyclase (GGDEF)-like protein
VQVSERDTLTGLYNRRMLDRRLHELMSSLGSPRRRTVDPISAHVALFDLDRFKKINDVYGHLYGDEVLLLFGGLMKQSFRSTDLLVRYGGEEFVVVLSDATLENCEIVLERFRTKVENYWFPNVGHVTISGGAARVGNQALPSTVLDQADQALYYAKHEGRNRVCHYEALVRDGLLEVQGPAFGNGQPFEEKRKLATRRKAGQSRSGKNARRS